MRTEDKGLSEEKIRKRTYGKSKLWSIEFLVVIGVLMVFSMISQVKAAPVIIEGDSEGSWSDTFNDADGVESSYNVNISDGEVKLKGYRNDFENETYGPVPNGWIIEGSGSSANKFNVLDHYYEPGQAVWLRVNDDLSAFNWQYAYREFSDYFRYLEFELTLHAISPDPERQGYFYIEFYNDTDTEYHEVRYYWDDARSGTPANSSTLTAVDLGYILDTGTEIGDKYFIFENISEDIDLNPNVDLNSILNNVTKVRYGFYVDAGPGWDRWEQVYIDNIGIYNDNYGNLTSTQISLPLGYVWTNLTINKTEPNSNCYINVTILDGDKNETIIGFENITATYIDISSIDYITYPNLRLYGSLVGTGNATPVLYEWAICWADLIPPATPSGFSVNNPFTGFSQVLSWNSNTEEDLCGYSLYYSTDNSTFNWLINFSTDSLSFLHSGLDLDTTYYYKIAAYDEVPNQSPFSEVINGTPDLDYDGDGIGNMDDPDDDNDGISDIDDPYPYRDINDMEVTLDNLTIDIDMLRIWLEVVIYNVEANINATNDTLHQQLDDLDSMMTNFYNYLTDDIGKIQTYLMSHDQSTDQNHSIQIDLLQQLLDGQIEKEKIEDLRTMLVNLAGNLSEHNQSIADDILNVVNNIDEFEANTDEQLDSINLTLEQLAQLRDILDDLEDLDQSLEQVEEDLQDSLDDKSTRDEDEDRFFVIELFIILLFVLLIINMILTVLMGKRKKEEGPPTAYQPPMSEKSQKPMSPPPMNLPPSSPEPQAEELKPESPPQ